MSYAEQFLEKQELKKNQYIYQQFEKLEKRLE